MLTIPDSMVVYYKAFPFLGIQPCFIFVLGKLGERAKPKGAFFEKLINILFLEVAVNIRLTQFPFPKELSGIPLRWIVHSFVKLTLAITWPQVGFALFRDSVEAAQVDGVVRRSLTKILG